MNAKQEILDSVDELCKCIERGWPISAFRFIQTIRAILSTHTLEPIGDGTPLAQECADLIEEAERRALENGRGDVAYRNAIHRLKLFLKDRKTSFFAGKEPIDDRAFDPTLCGFSRNNSHSQWYNNHVFSVRVDDDDGIFLYRNHHFVCKMPATQSEGERLLRLLGVLAK